MHESSNKKRTARILGWVCGSLFTLFSLLYLYVMQADLLATAQHLLSKGQTVYSPLWGAVIITWLLWLLQNVYRRTIAYPLRFHALYYFPSCLVLGLLTSIVPREGWEVQLSANWVWVIVSILVYVLVSWIALHYPDRKNGVQSLFPFLWGNFLCLAVQFCVVGGVANTDDVYHYRLKVERYVMEENDSMALHVGEESLQADRSLTALRAFALSREGALGERLFDYPQYYGSEGLMPDSADTIYVHGWLQLLYKHVGGKPGGNVKSATRFFELLSQRPSAEPAARDYLLCAYLLDKNLDAFVAALPRYYGLDAALPLYYKEALVLYSRLHTRPAVVFKDNAVEANLDDFHHFRAQYADPVERSNQCRRMYGNTYWWYYYYQELPARPLGRE